MRTLGATSKSTEGRAADHASRSATSPRQNQDGRSLIAAQRAIGNQRLTQMLKPDRAKLPPTPKLPFATASHASEQEADRVAQQVVNNPTATRGGAPTNQPLSALQRARFEPLVGRDLSSVRIHADARSAQMADALNAEAFTVGNHIYFGQGKFDPQNLESDRLLAHELVHVKQQARSGAALQPKLKITGTPANIGRVVTLLNTGLFGFDVSIDSSGTVSLKANKTQGPPTPQQTALATRLTNIINDPKDVLMTVSSGTKTLVGSYATGDFDIADIEKIGVHALIHEIEEQFQKQTKSMGYGSETTGAHGEGIKAESEVLGAKRGPQKIVSSKANSDGTIDAVAEVPYTFPDGSVKTLILKIKSNDVVSTTFK